MSLLLDSSIIPQHSKVGGHPTITKLIIFQGWRFVPESKHITLVSPIFRSLATICGLFVCEHVWDKSATCHFLVNVSGQAFPLLQSQSTEGLARLYQHLRPPIATVHHPWARGTSQWRPSSWVFFYLGLVA